MIWKALAITAGMRVAPIPKPMRPPTRLATKAYPMYFWEMASRENPRAFKEPIWVRCSSTIRVMVVRQARAATTKKMTGKMLDRLSTRSASWE